MIKYIDIPEKKQTIAIIPNTKYAAVNQIRKALRSVNNMYIEFNESKYLMTNSIKVTVTCQDGDEYSEEKGREIAKEKVLKKYYDQIDKRCSAFLTEFADSVFVVWKHMKNATMNDGRDD